MSAKTSDPERCSPPERACAVCAAPTQAPHVLARCLHATAHTTFFQSTKKVQVISVIQIIIYLNFEIDRHTQFPATPEYFIFHFFFILRVSREIAAA